MCAVPLSRGASAEFRKPHSTVWGFSCYPGSCCSSAIHSIRSYTTNTKPRTVIPTNLKLSDADFIKWACSAGTALNPAFAFEPGAMSVLTAIAIVFISL